MIAFEWKRIEDIVDNIDSRRKPLNEKERKEITVEGKYPYCGANGIVDYVDEYIFDKEILCIAEDGSDWSFNKKCSYIMNEKCWVNNHAHVVTAKSGIILKYLSYYLNYADLSSKITGTTRGKLTKSALNSIEVPIPSYKIQQSIVQILDKNKEIIEKRNEQIQICDELIKSQFIEMFGDPIKNEKNWEIVKLEKISSVGSSKRVFVEELVDQGVPFYRGTEIGALGAGETIEPTLFITEEHYDKLKISSGIPSIGDLLMPSICPDGRIWCVNTEKPFYFKDGRVLWIHLEDESISSIYLRYMLREKFARDYNSIASGTTFAELKIFALKSLDIMLPPLELQNQFATFVQQVNKLQFEMEQSLVELENNFNALMQRAFKGELF